jgi:hypothetical protein
MFFFRAGNISCSKHTVAHYFYILVELLPHLHTFSSLSLSLSFSLYFFFHFIKMNSFINQPENSKSLTNKEASNFQVRQGSSSRIKREAGGNSTTVSFRTGRKCNRKHRKRYWNFFPVAQQPPVGQGLLIIEASRSHSDTPHTVGLLWTSDQPDAEVST